MGTKSCKDFYDPKVGCCDSCHEDSDHGYASLPEIYTPSGKLFAIVCCFNMERAQAEADKS